MTQPASFAFDAASEALVTQAIASYPAGKQASAVMPLLDIAQRQMQRLTGAAWVPLVAMDEVARRLGLAPMRVYEIATFYTMYNRAPVGKYHLQVCTTTPCWLRGSDDIVAACKKIVGIKRFGETSADGNFTLTEVQCLGACITAPVLQINDDYFDQLTPETTEALLRALQQGEMLPPAGRYAGPVLSSAPTPAE